MLRYIGALISGVLHALEPDRDTVDVLDRDVAHCVDVWIRTAEVLVDDNPMTHLEAAGAREFVTRYGTDTDHDQIGVHVTVTRDHPGDCAVTSEPLDAGPNWKRTPASARRPTRWSAMIRPTARTSARSACSRTVISIPMGAATAANSSPMKPAP